MIDIVFIMPEITKGMKSFGPKALVSVKGATILEHQINNIRQVFKNNNIYLLTGFESEKVKKILQQTKSFNKKNIIVLNDPDYMINSQVASIKQYLNNKTNNNGTLFINNGIIPKYDFSKIDYNKNYIFLINGNKANFNIGSSSAQNIEYLFYDLPFLWSECLFLNPSSLDLLNNTISHTDTKTLFFFEIINRLLENNKINFKTNFMNKNEIIKISNIKDAKKIRNTI
jgi:hypothetical protein